MKGIGKLGVFIILVTLLSCQSYKLIQDDIDMNSKYGMTQMISGILTYNDFQQYKVLSRRSIVEDSELNETEKNRLLKSVDNLEFYDNKYVYFTMAYNMPFTDAELNFSFKLADAEGNNLLKKATLVKIKQYIIYSYGTQISYNYTWIVEAKKPMIDTYVSKEQQPLEFTVQFPDRRKRLYNIKI
ncbi:MAG TPA: hypothetical protein PK926_03125 [Spirochaetota bacterium]|nr:hypothetical protein [Spirochaetota bacterium]HPI91257.1 hypothetical protein [Spirochaetota bacterium]HPR47446.1 hypothetical protein [Spirochaetota bacterium]